MYYENIEGGHAGACDNKQRAFMKSLEYLFLWESLTKADWVDKLEEIFDFASDGEFKHNCDN